jgi:hypothetical protein
LPGPQKNTASNLVTGSRIRFSMGDEPSLAALLGGL